MCLSVPGKITEIKDDVAVVDYQGEKREASIILKPDVNIGDYVIVSAKMVMEIIPENEALKILSEWDKTDET